MCLQAQGIDDNNGVFSIVRRACRLSNNEGGIGKGRWICDASEGLETTTEVSRIQGQQHRLRRQDDRPEELKTMTEALSEENKPEVLTTTTEASDVGSE